MADDQEKTEEPTQKKIDDARLEGNVPKSQDMSGLFTLFVAILAFLLLFNFIVDHYFNLYRFYYSMFDQEFNRELVFEIAVITMREFLIMVIPLSLLVALAGVGAGISQFGFLFTTKPLIPDFKKIDPIKGIKNLISLKKMIEAIKITLKSFITLGVGFVFFFMFIEELPLVAAFTLPDQLEWLRDKAIILALVMLLITFVFALADIIIVRKQYFDQLKMSKQEVKDEMKNMDGDPMVKAKIRQIQMQMSRKRMMSEVPTADVVITNPTHYAVAIRYKEGQDMAPVVVAKGMNQIALNIKKIARENEVHIVQNPPLARSLYAEVDLEAPIPEALFQAVAEVLAYVYKMDKKR